MLLENRKLHVVLIAALGLLVYLNTLSVPFYLDDYTSLVNVPLVKNLSFFVDLDSARSYKGYGGFVSRYFGYLTFALNYRIGGLNVTGYHLVNIAVHLFAALMVYRLVLVTFRTGGRNEGGESRAGFTALLAALLFVLHPLQTQAVTYVVQRFASLAAMLYLLSLANYARARLAQREEGWSTTTICWYLASLLAAVLAFKTKEISYTLPLSILLYEVVFFRREATLRALLRYAAALLASLAALIVILVKSSGSIFDVLARIDLAMRLQTSMSRVDYLATQCCVLVTYLRLLIFPAGQQLDYDYPVYALDNLKVILSFAVLSALFGLGVYMLRRGNGDGIDGERRVLCRLVAFGAFWFFITLAIESSIIPIVDVIFEHRMYLPSAGIFIGAAALVSLCGRRGKVAAGWPDNGILVPLALVLLVFGGATVARNQLWRNEVALWQDNAEKTPEKARVFLNLGRARERKGDLAGAEKAYSRANALDKGLTDPLINLGLLYTQSGRLDEAMAKFRAVLALDPRHAEAHNNIGKIFGMRMQLDEALKEFQLAAQLKPNLAEPYNNIGYLHALRKNYGDALMAYQESISRNPDYVEPYYNRGVALVAMGKKKEARADFERVLELDPACAEATAQLQQIASTR